MLGDIIVNVDLNNIVSTLQYSNTALNFLIPNQLSPVSLAVDSNENVWVACFDTPYVLKFDKFGKYIHSITFNSYPINNPDFLEAWVNQSNKWVDVNSLPSNYTKVDVDDTYPIQPTCVDTDINNNIWVTYSNPFSGWLVKYNTTGSLLTSIQFPYYNSPYEIVCDNKNNLWVSTNNELENLGVNNGYLYYINGTTGAILTSFGHFNSINNLTIDNNQNLWFTYGYHYVGSINANNGNTITFPISSTTYSNNAPEWFNPNINADDSSLAGISSDFLNRIYVINSIENIVYVIDSNITQIIDQFHIQPKGFNPYLSAANTGTLFDFNNWTKSAQANGDWSGFRWINKYPNNRIQGSYTTDSNGVTYKNIVGSTSANYINFYPPNYYDLYKINENFNMAGQMQSVSFQEKLNQSENLFNFLSTIFGLSSHNDLGVKAYEKTANYTANVVDIDTCNVNNLYDLAESVDLNTDDFRLNYPVDIQRSIDLLSINQSRLFGSVLNDSFNFSTPSKYNNFNRGDLLDTTTYTVTAGVPVVLKAKSLNSYRLVPTGEVPLNDDIVSNLTMNGLTSYSLDTLAYFMGLKNSSYPWTQLYEFYEFVPSANEIYAQNTVDWDNQFMNINRDEYLLSLTNQISGMYPDSYLNWNNNNGMMEFIFTYQLYKGFGLI